jgi:hypothetical protein
MKDIFFKTISIFILGIVMTSYSLSNKINDNSLESTVITIIKAYQNEDKRTLNELINKDLKLIILHQPTMFYQIFITDSINPAPYHSCFFKKLRVNDYKIFFTEELPNFSCKSLWDKPQGIYCDSINTYKTLSTTAKNNYASHGWTSNEIKRFEDIERNSRKIIVIGEQGSSLYGGDFLIFYLTFYKNKWYLTLIEEPDYCSA